MDEADVRARREIYRLFVESGTAPDSDALAASLGLRQDEAADAMRRLHDARQIVLFPGELRIAKLLPFSCEVTPHRVEARARSWYANCAWDAFGITATLQTDGSITSSCSCCGEAIEIEVRGGTPAPDTDVVHFVVPAERWWDDIFFT